MVAGDVILSLPQSLVWFLNALGGIIVFYVVFNLVNTIIHEKRAKELNQVYLEMRSVNKNLDDIKKILKKI